MALAGAGSDGKPHRLNPSAPAGGERPAYAAHRLRAASRSIRSPPRQPCLSGGRSGVACAAARAALRPVPSQAPLDARASSPPRRCPPSGARGRRGAARPSPGGAVTVAGPAGNRFASGAIATRVAPLTKAPPLRRRLVQIHITQQPDVFQPAQPVE